MSEAPLTEGVPVVDDRFPTTAPMEGWVQNGAPVEVANALGEKFTVDPSHVREFVSKTGGHVVTGQEKLEERYGSAAGQFATFGLGGVEGLTMGTGLGTVLGVADVLGGQQTAKDIQQAAREAKQANPYAYMGGEMAGMVAQGAVVPGGGVYGALGEAVEGGAAKAIARAGVTGETALGRIGAKAVESGVRGMAETSLMNVSNALTEDSLGDAEANGQKLLAAATDKSVLLGGGIGAGFGAAGAGIGELGRSFLGTDAGKLVKELPGPRPKDALDEVAGVPGAGRAVRDEAATTARTLEEGQAAGFTTAQTKEVLGDLNTLATKGMEAGDRTLMDAAADAYAKAKSGGNPETEAFLKRVWEQRSGKVQVGIDDMDSLARGVAEKGNRLLRAEEALQDAMIVEKPAHMAKLVDEGRVMVARDAAIGVRQDIADTLAKVEQFKAMGSKTEGVNPTIKALGRIQNKLESAGEMSAGELFNVLDDVKRITGRHSGFGTEGPWMLTDAAKEMQGLYGRLRSGLEDEAVWGKAAAAQRDMNAATSKALETRGVFGKNFTATYGRQEGPEAFAKAVMDPGRAKAFLSSVGRAEGDMADQAAADFIAGMRNRARAAEEHLELTGAQKAAVADLRKAADEMEATLAKTKDEAAIANRIKAAQAEETGRGLGGVLGFAVDTVSSPIKTIDRLAAVKRTLERFDGVLETAVKGERGPVADLVSLKGPAKDAIVKEIDFVRSLASNPGAIAERARQMAGDLSSYAPKMAASVAGAASRMVSYLASIAPRGVVVLSLSGRKEVRYAEEDLAKYARVSLALKQPEAVVESAKHGRMNQDQITALKMVFPPMYEQIRQYTLDHIEQLDREGKLDKMPYDQKSQLQAILGISADPTTRPEFTALLQAAKQMGQPGPQAPGGGAKPRGAPSSVKQSWAVKYGTQSDYLEMRGGGPR